MGPHRPSPRAAAPARTRPSAALLRRVWTEIGGEPAAVHDALPDLAGLGDVPLPARTAAGELALGSTAAATLAAGRRVADVDVARVAAAYRSDRLLTVDDASPPAWSPLSGFWPTADGWIRTHGNYPHHARGLRSALGLAPDAGRPDVAAALAALPRDEAVRRIVHHGGLAVSVRAEQPEHDARLRTMPLIEVARVGDAAPSGRPASGPPSPLAGIRVLDLTRVIAGPVCTRTLALLGADVLRIDPPAIAELPWQHLDTGHGKRSTILDARDPAMSALLATADVVVLGYRPASLARLGLSPDTLVERYPGLVVAELSAWGADAPERAGFDSLVQAESGIAVIEGDDGVPGALPAQALDHSSGYLLAAAVTTLLGRRAREGGSWIARTSLRRVAAELLGMPRRTDPVAAPDPDAASHEARFDVDGVSLVTAAPVIPGTTFTAPHPWGSDAPRW
ncbi:CoA transferase [Microbacterium sp. K35]|uniref:CoA transferase n=1 Tax=Microbacterium sp. K35 TaxID=2305440 RepID=UPI00109BD99B|nr:CoA transferase [Microbacterium sp. K35]